MLKKRNTSPSIAVLTLGCPKNVVDSEILIGKLKTAGVDIAPAPEYADWLVVNTCGFIKSAAEESVDVILEAAELKNSGKVSKIIVMGCLPQRFPNVLKEQIKDIDFVFGVNDSDAIIKEITGEKYATLAEQRFLLTPPHYAYLKIAEGCNHKCSFCTIPSIRGSFRSKTIEELVREAETLAAAGVIELNVIAQDTTFYGVDTLGRKALPELLSKLSDIKALRRIRLMYTYPTAFPTETLDVIAEKPNICKYIDIPLQHISDSVLKSMKRGMTSNETRTLVEQIRRKIPGVAIRSTFIVGYPNETEEDFKQLHDFLQETRLERVGVFCYSHEEGSASYELGDTVPEEVKNERRDILMRLQAEISLENNKKLIGNDLEVMIDDFHDEGVVGRTQCDAPEVDNSVIVRTKKNLRIGSLQRVKVEEADYYDLFGSI